MPLSRGRTAARSAATPKRPGNPLPAGAIRLAMASGVWICVPDETPGSPMPRGLYQRERDEDGQDEDGQGSRASRYTWVFRSKLPWVHARIIRRDGSGKRIDTDYLISADRNGPRVIVPSRRVHSGDWQGAVGIPLSDDQKIIAAAGTAIRYMIPLAKEVAGEREAAPKIGADGKVKIPVPETVPPGYLEVSPLGRVDALTRWREIVVPVAAGNPCFALVLGGAAISPFVGWLDYADTRAFIVDLAGEPNGGKSTTVRTAGAIWGAVPKAGGGVVKPWNLSPQAPGRALGMLGILPAIFDEQGLSGYTPDQWSRVILGITDGSREAADRDGGIRVGLPYSGVVISTGNASIAAGLGAGRYAGIGPKRVNTLTGPFTSSAEQAEALPPVIRDAYGHPGKVILDRFTGPEVAALVDQARATIGVPAGTVGRSAGKTMHLLVAGAAILDAVLGTGTRLRDAAVKGARDYLKTQCFEPEHDADRMLTALRESLSRAPGQWPTVSEYREIKRTPPYRDQDGKPADPDRVDLPQHGIDREISGVRADDGSWFAVFGGALDKMLGDVGADRSIALAKADKRGWLHRTDTDRRDGAMPTVVKHVGRAYRFNLPAEDEDEAGPGSPERAANGPDPAGPDRATPEPETGAQDGSERCAGCDHKQPLHAWDCPSVVPLPPEPPDFEPEDEPGFPPEDVGSAAMEALALIGTEIPASEVPALADPEPPFTMAVRAYLADCEVAGLSNAYHPTPAGAVKVISHHGKAEADEIRAAYAQLTGATPKTSAIASPKTSAIASPRTEPEPAKSGPGRAAIKSATYVDDGRLGINLPPAGDDHGQDAVQLRDREPERGPRPERSAEDERSTFIRSMRKTVPEATDEDLTAALAIFHEVTGGLRWVSYPGQVGQAWFAKLAAQFPSMKPPVPLVSPKVAEITEAGPLTRINFVAKPKSPIRAGRHHVTAYDVNGQHPAAAGSAELGDGEPEVITSPRDLGGLVNLPGYVRLSRALRTGHPGFGTIPAGKWVAMPLVKFMTRDLHLTVPVAEVVYWPKHGRRLTVYVDRYRQARERLMRAEQTPAVRLALAALKSQANAFIGMFHSETYSHGGWFRPDWYDMIVATAEANALRALVKCKTAPIAKMADTAYWIGPGLIPMEVPELMVSAQLGKWKRDRFGSVSDDLIAAVKDGSPAGVRDAVIRIDAERRAAL